MEKNTIGGFIAALRKANGMTQQELANRLNVSNKTVSKWECNECYPEIMLIPVIAEIFGVTSDEILKGERIPGENAGVKPTAQTEKQMGWLIQSSISKYKNLCYIAAALFIMGFIVSLILAFTIFEPVFGFGVVCVFVLAGVILQMINFNRTHSVLNSDYVTKADPKLFGYAFETLFRHAVNVFGIAAAAVLLSLPLIIVFEVQFPYGIEYMTAFNLHMYNARPMALASIIIYWAAKTITQYMLSLKDRYSGITVFSHNKKITVVWLVISAFLVILLF